MHQAEPDPLQPILDALDGDDLSFADVLIDQFDPENDRETGRLRAMSLLLERERRNESDLDQNEDADAAWLVHATDRAIVDLTTPESRFALAIELSDQGVYTAAESAFRTIAIEMPDNIYAMLNLAVVLERADRQEEALEVIDDAIGIEPEFPGAHMQRANCLRALHRLEDAASAYARYLELVPDDTDEWISLGIVRCDIGDREGAYEAYERAEETKGDKDSQISLFFNWGVTAVRFGDADRVKSCLDRLELIGCDDWRIWSTRASFHEARGEIAAGWTNCEHMLEESDPEADEVHGQTVATAILYAARNGLLEEVADLVTDVFEVFSLYTDDRVVEALRQLRGRPSENVLLFDVNLEGRLSHDEAEDLLGSVTEPMAFLRHYSVFADDAEAAVSFALAFEERIGCGHEIQIDEVESYPDDEPEAGVTGVARCSSMIIFPSGE